MAKEKIKCVVRGKILELSPVAYEMAKEYFGAAKVSDLNITKPIELSKPILIPKIQVKVEKPEELTKKEPEWDEKLKDVKTVEMTVGEVPEELAAKVVEKAAPKKPRAKKK